MNFLVGILALLFAVVNARRIAQWIRAGEAHLIVSAAGDGLFGGAERAENPIGFWLAITFNAALCVAAIALALWLAFRGNI